MDQWHECARITEDFTFWKEKIKKIQKVDLEMNENNIIKTIDGCTAHCTLTKNVMHTYAQCETFIMHMKQ